MATKRMMMGLILFQMGRHIAVVIATNLHADYKTRCISYKEVLPNGICINELKHYKISQSPLQAKSSNRKAQWFKVFLLLVENKTREQVLFYGKRIFYEFFSRTRFFNCRKNSKFKKILKDLKIDMKMISLRCIDTVRRIICHIMHPVCFKSEEDGRIISSPPCRRLCTESDCENFIKTWLYNITLQIYKLCPNRIRDPRKHRDLYTCAQFPMADMKHVERCQNIIKRKENRSESCYNGDVTSYNGTANITSTGKTCLPWNINPFLTSPVYSNLRNNYCRNPQGYATSPWCYVNATNRDWEFCDVPKCEGSKANIKNVNSTSIEIKVLIVVSVLVFIFVLVLVSWKIYRVWRKKKDDDKYIEPYYVCDVSDEEKMSQLLRLPTRNGY